MTLSTLSKTLGVSSLAGAAAATFFLASSSPVPNHAHVVSELYATGRYSLQSHEGQATFVDDAVLALHRVDSRWGHLRKNPGQTQIHGHAEDAALYLSEEPGQSTAVDFIGGAGGPNPKVGWVVDQPRYNASDWFDAHNQWSSTTPGPVPLPPQLPPAPKPYPGDQYFTDAVGVPLDADYREAGQRLNAGSATWFARTIWRHVGEGMPMDESVAQSRKEWRAALGLPPVP